MLSRAEAKTGTPEKPLSVLGKLSYESYWKHAVLDQISANPDSEDVSINEISNQTGMTHIDVINTFKKAKLIQVLGDEHVVVRDPELMQKHVDKREGFLENAPDYLRINKEKLQWIPPAQRASWSL